MTRWRIILVIGAIVSLSISAILVYRQFWKGLKAPVVPQFDLVCSDAVALVAIREARQQVEMDPRSSRSWGHLGMLLYAHGFVPEALQCLGQAGQLDPRNQRWVYLQARLLLPDDPIQGISRLREAVGLDESQAFVRARLAEELLELGNLDEAECHFLQITKTHSEDARAHLGLGRIDYQRGSYSSSLEHLNHSIAQAPNVRASHALLATIHYRLNNAKKAGEEFALAKSLSDKWSWPDPYMEEVGTYRSGAESHLNQAAKLLQQGKTREAKNVLRELIATFPNNAAAYEALGQTLINEKNWIDAEVPLSQAVRLNPNNVDAQCNLGLALLNLGRLDEAASYFRAALDIKPQHAWAHYQLGLCLVHKDNLESAITEMRSAIRCRPDLAAAHRDLGNLLVKNNRPWEGILALKQALKLDPSDPLAKKSLNDCWGRVGFWFRS
jgi:tetratricopeptide (TPR) repeat protein